jgi:hypothetical protein
MPNSNKEEMLKKLRAGDFIENNGTVIRAVNLLRHQYIELKSVYRAITNEMTEQAFLDCINYLSQEGYIILRAISDDKPAQLADYNYTLLEALVSSKGIRLLGGIIHDEMVDV